LLRWRAFAAGDESFLYPAVGAVRIKQRTSRIGDEKRRGIAQKVLVQSVGQIFRRTVAVQKGIADERQCRQSCA
jgi:hypothetical protein